MSEVCAYAGLIIGLAVIGTLIILRSEQGSNLYLAGGLCFAAYLLLEVHYQTTWTMDKNLAYGIWFAVIAAGYAASKLIRWVPGSRPQIAALCCAAALVYPAVTGWESAWQRYHAWPDANEFVSSFSSVATKSQGPFYLPGQEANIAEYYTAQGSDWTRWRGDISFNPVTGPHSSWNTYYSTQLRNKDYGVIALFYSTTFSSVRMPGTILLPRTVNSYHKLLGLVGNNSESLGFLRLRSLSKKMTSTVSSPLDTTTRAISLEPTRTVSTQSGRRREHS